jgi:gliding motility-associated-like protein
MHMRNKLNTLLLTVTLAFTGKIALQAQNPAACMNYQTLCSNPAVTFTSVGGTGLNGGGVSNPAPNPTPPNLGCMLTNAPNPQWFMINVTVTGTLGFSFGAATSANPQTNFLHWIMWPYTPATCANIFNNTLPPVACNYNCTQSGGTGMGPVPVGGNPCNYQPAINVVQGQKYMILISNGTGVNPTLVSYSTTSAGSPGGADISCNPLTIPNTTACPGQQTVVTASWLGASNTTYSIYAPGVPAPVVQTSPNFTVSNVNGGPYQYTVNATGTNAFNQPISASQNFTLTINPTSTMSVAHATNYCYNSAASITLTPAQGTFNIVGPSIATPPTTNSVITLNNLQSPTNNGIYTVYANPLSTGCTASVTLPINIAPVSFIAVNNQGKFNRCENTIWNNMGVAMPTATSYVWVGPNAFTATVNPPAAGGSGDINIASLQTSHKGDYTITANYNFNGVACPQSLIITLDVVKTGTITAATSATYCQGETIVLTGTANPTPQTYQWSGPGMPGPAPFFYTSSWSAGNTVPPTPSVVLTNSAIPPGGQYLLTAFYTNGVVNCPIQQTHDVYVVSVNPVLVLMPPQGLVCQYANANMAVSAVGAASYTWTGPNPGFTGNTTATIVAAAQPSNSGIYCVKVTYALGAKTCTAEGCNQLTVIPVNSITVVPDVTTCYPGLNSNVNLYSSAIGATSYSWNGPNSYTNNVPNPIIYYAPLSATGIYTVTTTFTAGGLTCYNSNTVNVSVNPVIFFSLPSYTQTCKEKSVTFNGPPGAVSYSWTSSVGIPASVVTNGQNLVLNNLQPTQSGLYVLTVASTGSCTTSRTVEINVLTPISYTLAQKSLTTCAGAELLFEMGATGGSEVYDYQWYPSSYLSTPNSPVVTANPFGTTVYNVLAHDVACPDYTVSHAFTVLVLQAPTPQLVLKETEGCEPLCLDYNAQIKDAAIVTYDFGGLIKVQTAPTDSGRLGRYCLPNPGTYNLKITVEGTNGCNNTFPYPAPIIVYPKSRSEIAWTPDVPTTNENMVTFSPVVKAGNVVSQSWMFTGTGVSGEDTTSEKHPQRKYMETGQFPIMLVSTTDKGCIDTTVSNIEIRDDLSIFIPNSFTPNGDGINDNFQVKGLGFKVESFVLEIFDRWGHSIYSTKDVAKGWDGTAKGTASMEGVYIYKVRVVGANGEGKKEYIGHVTLLK